MANPAWREFDRFAICNETFAKLEWPQAKVFEFAAECGYRGVEIAPFTIDADVNNVTAVQTSELVRDAERAGVEICGLHWILTKTEGLLLTSADAEVRKRTAAYLGTLAQWCRDLGGGVMVLGSPNQRNRPDGMSMAEGYHNAAACLEAAAPAFEAAGVTLALEPLATWETNFLLTAEDAVRLAGRVDSPRVKIMLDCKAMWAMEPEPVPEVVRRYADWSVHFHANDPNLQGPGFGELSFGPIFAALADIAFDGWVSVEVFDYSPGPEKIAIDSLQHMRSCLHDLA